MESKSVNTVEYIKMVKEGPEKRRSYAFFAFTIIATILLTIFAIKPTITTILRINKEIKQKEHINQQLTTKISTLSSLQTKYLERKKDFRTLSLVFPADGNFSLLLSNIDSIVSRNGFVLNSVTFDDYEGSKKAKNRVLSPKSMRINVKGKRANIINLLKEFEALPMYPIVDFLSFSSNEDEEGLVSFSVGLRIYDIEKNNKFYDE